MYCSSTTYYLYDLVKPLVLLSLSFLICKTASLYHQLLYLSTDCLGLELRHINNSCSQVLHPLGTQSVTWTITSSIPQGCGDDQSHLWKSTVALACSGCSISLHSLPSKALLWLRGLIWNREVREVFCWNLECSPILCFNFVLILDRLNLGVSIRNLISCFSL